MGQPAEFDSETHTVITAAIEEQPAMTEAEVQAIATETLS